MGIAFLAIALPSERFLADICGQALESQRVVAWVLCGQVALLAGAVFARAIGYRAWGPPRWP